MGVSDRSTRSGPGLGRGLLMLAGRPVLLWEAVRAGVAMRRRHAAFPSSHYLAWRLDTAYGHGAEARPEDLASYLSWRRRMRALS
jgi:hypothetical protein